MSVTAQKLDTAPDPMALVRAWRRMRAAGFEIRAAGDSLQVSPFDRLTDPQRAYIRAHKAVLVGLLEDAETLARALVGAGPAGLGWREGTPAPWPVDRLMAAGEVLYSDGRMVNRMDRRYLATSAPAIDGAPECHPPDSAPPIEAPPPLNVVPLDREAYEERAAIMEFEGGLPRDEAEAKALALAIRAQELQAQGWDAWNAKARAESEALPGWEPAP